MLWHSRACLRATRCRATDVLGPIPVGDYIARLATQVHALGGRVGLAADLQAALAQRPAVMPCAYVVSQERAVSTDRYSDRLAQTIEAQIIVVTFASHAGESRTGAAARHVMDALLASARLALMGWRAPAQLADIAGLELVAVRDELYRNNAIVTQQVFLTTYDLEVFSDN